MGRTLELITKKFLYNGGQLKSRFFNIEKDIAILVFADKIDLTLINHIKEFLSLNLEVVVISLDKTNFRAPNLHILTVNRNWFLYSLFKDSLYFHFVYAYGEKAQTLVLAYSQFTLYKIEIIKNIDQLKEILSQIKNKALIQIFNGFGDALMALPALKKLSKKYEIEVSVIPDRAPVFKNLSYIKKVSTQRKGINLSYYKKFYDLTSKFCNYNSPKNRKHRIDIIADLLDVSPVEHNIDIILDDDEIKKAQGLLKLLKRKLVFFYESNEKVRCLPDDYVNSLVPQIKNFDVILVGRKKKNWKVGYDLSGKIDLRTLFAVVYLSDLVLTVDTSGLHIARAFKKPTILLPGLIDYRWRIYDNVSVIPPKIFCYPCNRHKPQKAPCLLGKTCPSFIPKEKILQKIASF